MSLKYCKQKTGFDIGSKTHDACGNIPRNNRHRQGNNVAYPPREIQQQAEVAKESKG
jgi:hypothetical protein